VFHTRGSIVSAFAGVWLVAFFVFCFLGNEGVEL